LSQNVSFDLLLSELGRLSAQIGEHERQLSTGTAATKVRAAGELAELRQRADSVRNRLERLRGTESSGVETLKTELELELRHLAEAFERWLDAR
jgi:hypothetical protein